MNGKYVIVGNEFIEYPILIGMTRQHKEVICPEGLKFVSAGYFTAFEDVKTRGDSMTLRLSSREQDARIIKRHFEII